MKRLLAGFKLKLPECSLLVRACRILVIGLFAIIALQNLGVELLPLVAALSIVFTKWFLVANCIPTARA